MINKIKKRIEETEIDKLSWEDLEYLTKAYISIIVYEKEEFYRNEIKELIYNPPQKFTVDSIEKGEDKYGL